MQIIPSWVFYAIHVVESLRFLFQLVGALAMGITLLLLVIIAAIYSFDPGSDKEYQIGPKTLKITKSVGVIAATLLLVSALLPPKKTMYLMLADRFATYENVELAMDGVKESIDYIFDRIEGIK